MGALSTNFESLYGHKPQVISEAPGRVNLIGEHIDYSDGFVLPFALPFRTVIVGSRLADGCAFTCAEVIHYKFFHFKSFYIYYYV